MTNTHTDTQTRRHTDRQSNYSNSRAHTRRALNMYWCLWKVQFWASYFFYTPMILFITSKSTFHDPSGYTSTCLLPEKECFRVYICMLVYICSIMFFLAYICNTILLPHGWTFTGILLVVIDTIVSFQSGRTLKFLLVLGCTTSTAEA